MHDKIGLNDALPVVKVIPAEKAKADKCDGEKCHIMDKVLNPTGRRLSAVSTIETASTPLTDTQQPVF